VRIISAGDKKKHLEFRFEMDDGSFRVFRLIIPANAFAVCHRSLMCTDNALPLLLVNGRPFPGYTVPTELKHRRAYASPKSQLGFSFIMDTRASKADMQAALDGQLLPSFDFVGLLEAALKGAAAQAALEAAAAESARSTASLSLTKALANFNEQVQSTIVLRTRAARRPTA
jgi:hypothetical protein